MASPRKAKRLAAAEAARSGSSTRTHVLGVLAGGAVLTVFTAEVMRVWKLGTLPRSRQVASEEDRRAKPIEAVMAAGSRGRVAEDGLAVAPGFGEGVRPRVRA